MGISSLEELRERASGATGRRPSVAVAAAHEEHVIGAVVRAVRAGMVDAILIGREGEVRDLLAGQGEDPERYRIVDRDSDVECVETAVALVRGGEADVLMKGIVETRDFMRGVVDREHGLRTGRLLSTIGIFEVPGYPKLLSVCDVAITPMPSLDGKRQIVEECVECLHALGIDEPKVAMLSAAEQVNPKVLGSEDAAELARMQRDGEIGGCVVDGPISFDLATSPEAARIKHYESPVAGQADLIVVPDLVSGNVLAKSLMGFGGATVAGLVLGASAPIVLTSRSAGVEDKLNSIALAALASRGNAGR